MGSYKWKQFIGKKFNRLTILERDYNHKSKRTYVYCRCDCGNEKSILLQNVVNESVKSCGCYIKEIQKNRKTTHTYSRTRLYRIFQCMKQRCYNPKDDRYKNYGGRGIKICDEWLNDFTTFYDWAINNKYSEDLTIERIDVDGNYCPENCTWIPNSEQGNNRTNNHWVEYNGERFTAQQVSRKYNIQIDTLLYRLKHWDIEKAIKQPIQEGHKKWKKSTT